MKLSSPEQVGFSTTGLKRLDQLLGGYIDSGKLAGISATVAREGNTIYLAKFGFADTQPPKPIEFDTIFRIASMTKPITSVAAMLLYEDGEFHLNTPVSAFIPEFKDLKVFVREEGDDLVLEDLKTQVTMRHLFTHTSGMVYGFNPADPVDRQMIAARERYGNRLAELDNAAVVSELVKLPLAFQPGTHWRYGMNLEVLGRIIEIISGQSLADFLKQRIFDPLGMPDTDFFVPEDKINRLAATYAHPEGPEKLIRRDFTPQTQLPKFQSGGGGLVSTLPDFARFCQMLVNAGELEGVRLLSPTTVAMYSINQCPEQALPLKFGEDYLYHAGYGFSLGTRVLMSPAQSGIYGSEGEFGWDGAYGTYVWIDPLESLYGLLMFQHSPIAYYPIASQFKQVTYSAMMI